MKSIFKYPEGMYDLENLLSNDGLTSKQLRAEYSRLRGIAQKRLARLKSVGYADTKAYRYNATAFPTLKNLTDEEAAYRLAKLSTFLRSQSSTLTGWKGINQKRAKAWENYGFKIPKDKAGQKATFANIDKVMQHWRVNKLGALYTSERVVIAYHEAEGLGVGIKDFTQNFEWWLENIGSVMEAEIPKEDGKTYSTANIRKTLGK